MFQTKHGAYNTASLIEFLTDLREHLGGQPVTLIWDGLPAQNNRRTRSRISTSRSEIAVSDNRSS